MNDLSISQAKYLAEHIRHKRIVSIARIMVFVIFMLLWEVTTRLQIIDSFIFSSPSRIATTFISMTKDGSIFTHIGITLAESLLSFMLVNVIGVAVAVLLWLSKKTSEIMEPYLVVLNSLPKSALAPLLYRSEEAGAVQEGTPRGCPHPDGQYAEDGSRYECAEQTCRILRSRLPVATL